MSRDLFGDVTDPFVTLGTRKWYTVPVSLALHVVIVAALVIVPLMATSALPLLEDPGTMYMPVAPPEPPTPPDVRPKPPELLRADKPDAAPLVEPRGIVDPPLIDVGFEAKHTVDSIVGGGTLDGTAVVAPPPPVELVAAKPDMPVRVGGTIRAPARVTYAAPVYPPIALSARLQGLVIIDATIDTSGRVVNARVMRSDSPLFTEAALSAVRQWTYTPTLLNGMPVSVIMTVTVQFRLQ